ncbi:MAG: phosphatase PAP2 family protein [Thermodesulfobacteriota bacterium]
MNEERKFFIKVSLFIYFIWLLAFEAVGLYAVKLPTYDITSIIDKQIPLIPEFIWSYILCYVFPFLPLFVIKDWHRFNRALLAIILSNLSAFIVYLTFPLAFPRPELGQSFSERMLSFEYWIDFYPGANKLPSLHVIFTWIVYLSSRRQRLNKLGDSIIFLVAVMITISALFVKQHIIVDVIAGLFWAFTSWKLAGYLYGHLTTPHMNARNGLNQIVKKFYRFVLLYVAIIFSVIWLR